MDEDEIKTLPNVGDIVTSKTLKLKRIVIDVDSKTITVKAIRTGAFKSLFDSLSFDYSRTMRHEDFYVSYDFSRPNTEQSVKVTPEEINTVFIKLGVIYKNIDTEERVIMGSTKKSKGGLTCLEVLSCDRQVDGEYLSYLIEENYFKMNFVSLSNPQKFKNNLSTSF